MGDGSRDATGERGTFLIVYRFQGMEFDQEVKAADKAHALRIFKSEYGMLPEQVSQIFLRGPVK